MSCLEDAHFRLWIAWDGVESGRPGCAERCNFAVTGRHEIFRALVRQTLAVGSGQRDSPRIAMTEAVETRSSKDVSLALER